MHVGNKELLSVTEFNKRQSSVSRKTGTLALPRVTSVTTGAPGRSSGPGQPVRQTQRVRTSLWLSNPMILRTKMCDAGVTRAGLREKTAGREGPSAAAATVGGLVCSTPTPS